MAAFLPPERTRIRSAGQECPALMDSRQTRMSVPPSGHGVLKHARQMELHKMTPENADRIELEAARGEAVLPATDRRRFVPEPLPVRLLTVDDATPLSGDACVANVKTRRPGLGHQSWQILSLKVKLIEHHRSVLRPT